MKIPIIAFAPHPWDESQWMNRQHLLSRLGRRGWHIVYTNGPLNLWNRYGDSWKKAPFLYGSKIQDHVSLINAGKILPRWPTSPTIDKLAIKYYTNQIKKAAAISNHNDFVCLCFHPMFWPYIKAMNPQVIAFHAYDNYTKQGEWRDEQQHNLEELVQKANLITASSKGIASSLQGNRSQEIKILENGVDFQLFSTKKALTCPTDMKLIPYPRIIYTGAINRKVDIPLISKIAKLHKNWNWVLVGRFEKNELLNDNYQSTSVKQLLTLPNVYILGEKERTEIPNYLLNSDVTTMCYRSIGDGWWNDISPLKMHEYLAVGKPVISAPLETILPYSNVIDIARTTDEWISAIQRALKIGGVSSPEKRREVALSNTWEQRVDLLEQWLLESISSTIKK